MKRCAVIKATAASAALFSPILRNVICSAPPSGIPLAEIETKLREHLSRATTSDSGGAGESLPSPSFLAGALVELSELHYIGDSTLYPCDWSQTLRDIAVALPREGVTEPEVLDHIRDVHPLFTVSGLSLGGGLFSTWIHQRFPHILSVSRSAASRAVILYRSVQEPRSQAAEHIFRALQRIDRADVPVYTDFSLIAPLLPNCVGPRRGDWMAFLQSDAVRQCFDVAVEAEVRLAPGSSPNTVFIDGTSVDVASINNMMAVTGILGPLCAIKVFRRANGPAWSNDDVILQEFLDPEHAIGAAIASLGEKSNTRVHVLCSDDAKPRYEAALLDLLGTNGKVVEIITPSTEMRAK